MPDPEPLQSVWPFFGERAVVKADAGGIKDGNLLESDGQVAWVGLEQREVLVGEIPDVVRKLAIMKPEIRIGEVIQSGVQRPAS